MLVLTRRRGEVIRLSPQPGLDPAMPVGELFKNGPIRIVVLDTEPDRVHIGIEASPGIAVARGELPPKT